MPRPRSLGDSPGRPFDHYADAPALDLRDVVEPLRQAGREARGHERQHGASRPAVAAADAVAVVAALAIIRLAAVGNVAALCDWPDAAHTAADANDDAAPPTTTTTTAAVAAVATTAVAAASAAARGAHRQHVRGGDEHLRPVPKEGQQERLGSRGARVHLEQLKGHA